MHRAEYEYRPIGLSTRTSTIEQPEPADAPKNSVGAVARGDVTPRPR
jgi:hypothetical protein